MPVEHCSNQFINHSFKQSHNELLDFSINPPINHPVQHSIQPNPISIKQLHPAPQPPHLSPIRASPHPLRHVHAKKIVPHRLDASVHLEELGDGLGYSVISILSFRSPPCALAIHRPKGKEHHPIRSDPPTYRPSHSPVTLRVAGPEVVGPKRTCRAWALGAWRPWPWRSRAWGRAWAAKRPTHGCRVAREKRRETRRCGEGFRE